MNVAVHTIYRELLANRLFEMEESNNANREALERYHALRKYLESEGIRIETYDVFAPGEKIDHWVFIDPPGDIYRFLLRHGINPRRSLLFLVEPPVGNPTLYDRKWLYFHIFGRVLSWNSNFIAAHNNFSKFLLPYHFDADNYPRYCAIPKRNLCVMMHSNKTSPLPGELYSLRREVISYFERRGDALLDLYGQGWNDASSSQPFFTTCHKGWVSDKKECLASHYYSLCIDNMLIPGYLTYDPFISMSVGTVPVYLPMPDSDQYIPKDAYVDFGAFGSMDNLITYLADISKTETYEEMRKNGWKFINSPAYRPFTLAKFCEDVHGALMKLAGRSEH